MLSQKTKDMFASLLANTNEKPLMTRNGPRSLTAREKKILIFLVDGKSYGEIGKEFDVTGERIKQYVARVKSAVAYTEMVKTKSENTENTLNSLKDSGKPLSEILVEDAFELLSVRNGLLANGIHTLADLDARKNEIYRFEGFGAKKMTVVKEILDFFTA
jgi:DNA-binding CsgD family transcriptional regulator